MCSSPSEVSTAGPDERHQPAAVRGLQLPGGLLLPHPHTGDLDLEFECVLEFDPKIFMEKSKMKKISVIKKLSYFCVCNE